MLKKVFILFLFVIIFCPPAFSATYESVGIINSKNWAQYFTDHLGFYYDSHGCLHFSPSDIYLLTKTIPKGADLQVKTYSEKSSPDNYSNLPFFNSLVNSSQDVMKYASLFKQNNVDLIVYPALSRLYIILNGNPFAQVKVLAGSEQFYKMVFDLTKDGKIDWDFTLATPTDPGRYKILGSTDHYLSNNYRDITIVPFGAWIEKYKGKWIYRDNNNWYQCPKFIVDDLEQPFGKQDNLYYDVMLDDSGKISAAKWAGNDFGEYVLLWSKDGKNFYPEMGYAEGLLLYEQTMLVKDLADILTVDSPDDLESCVKANDNFSSYKQAYDFIASKGASSLENLDPIACSYYRLFNGFNMSDSDYQNIDPRLIKAFNAVRANNLPPNADEKYKILGLYYYIRNYDLYFEKQAGWYAMLNDDWPFYADFRVKLRNDFNAYGLYSTANRRLAMEKFINDRLEFRLITAPEKAKRLSFADFFKQDKEVNPYTEREKEAIRNFIISAASNESQGVPIESVGALNNYNFGLLLDEMLGSLYKSHGCLHVSPRNIYIANKTLPIGAKISIKGYSEKPDASIKSLKDIAEMVNFEEDITAMAKKFANPSAIKIAVYPGSNICVFYLNNKPFAKMHIETGFPSTVKMVDERDKNGKPTFKDAVAFPTPSGSYYIFKKLVNYVSNIYYDTTIVPQGAQIKKKGNDWVFYDESGKLRSAPSGIQADLNLSPDKQTLSFYDIVLDNNGKVISARWGGNTFGWYPIQISRDRRSPAPELIHSSGDLIMEQRQLVGELIKVLSAPEDSFDKCIKYSKNFDLYTTCYNFIEDPNDNSGLEPLETASYKLYMELPMNNEERAMLPKDAFVAYKIFKKKGALTKEEQSLLVSEGIASYSGGQLNIDMAKVYGILYDLYEYVIAIEKNANIYKTLKDNWGDLSEIRQAFLNDLNRFLINDPEVFKQFVQELVIERAMIKKLNQKDAYGILERLLE